MLTETRVPLYTESDELLGFRSDEELRTLISAGRAKLIRDRSGKSRRAYMIADERILDHFRWRGKMSGGFAVMQAERLEFGRMALAKGTG